MFGRSGREVIPLGFQFGGVEREQDRRGGYHIHPMNFFTKISVYRLAASLSLPPIWTK